MTPPRLGVAAKPPPPPAALRRPHGVQPPVAAVIDHLAGVGSWELDPATSRIVFSSGIARMFGLRPGEGLDEAELMRRAHPADRELLGRSRELCLSVGAASFELRILTAAGEQRWLAIRAELVRHGGRETICGVAVDVTEQRAAERQRREAAAMYSQAFEASPIGMALSDTADGRYTRVNDAFCRLLGRSREELLATGVPGVTHPDDFEASREARASLISGRANSFQAEKRYLRPDGSAVWAEISVTAVRDCEERVVALHTQAVDITERREREARMQRELADGAWLARTRDALDHGGLVLHAQPIVDLRTGETVRHELLLRMRSDDGTLVAPGSFLPVAERYGLICEIDRWVARRAVELAAAGRAVEFNVSSRSVSEESVLDELAAALSRTGADPERVVVEVTETAIMDQPHAGRAFARRVHELGCRLALDDFGTGFGSLSHLKNLPADTLKIDIEFVRDVVASETDSRLVRGIVSLAREFGQTTIAEGVEDQETLECLRRLGVDQAQGYLLGRPGPLT